MKEVLKEWREFLNEKKQPPRNLIPQGYVEYETREGDTVKDLIVKQNLPYETTTPQGKWNYNNIQMEIGVEYGRVNPGTEIKQLEIPVGTKTIVPFTSGLARVTPADKLVRKVKDFDPAKDIDTFIDNLSKQARKIKFGFTHPGQPTPTRITNVKDTSTELVQLGPAELDKVLAWLINNMRFHASLLGIIEYNSRYLMPVGRNSGLRSEKVQKKNFIAKFKSLDQELGWEMRDIKRGNQKLTEKDEGEYFLNGKPVKNLAWAIHMVARQEIARPFERLTLKAHNGDIYKTHPGEPKHLTGRTIDFFLQGDEGSLKIPKNNTARNSNTGKFLDTYGPMYGLVNYNKESWHWELNKANRNFFAKMMANNQSPLKNALASLPKLNKGLAE